MARKLDYDALRAQTLGSGSDEAVTVNTRALIDKVLARYSGEWTTLRELLQNAADASAKQVVVRFETLPSPTVPVPQTLDSTTRLRHVLLHHTVKSTVIENDGEVFRPTDWARLKKIAEGNPDETKIGAFGVGFYSVFADSEEPFVSSGKEALAFYWKGDALFTKRLQLSNDQSTTTTFMLPMRNTTSPIPNLLSLCQFLTTSLTFVGLEKVELWLDEWRIFKLAKKTAPSVNIQIPKEVNRKTREGLMEVTSVSKEAAQLDAQWLRAVEWKPQRASLENADSSAGQGRGTAPAAQSLRSFFSRLAPSSSTSVAVELMAKVERDAQEQISTDLLGMPSATFFVHINKAYVRTSPNLKFSAELERATKKPPPKTTIVSLLCASYDETTASSTSSSQNPKSGRPKVFDSFLPVNGRGKIFIGFTTNQTTGLNIHISTPSIIPTVERESIDLNNRFVRVWNMEILRVAGIVVRICWGQEAIELREKLSRAMKRSDRVKIGKEDVSALLPDALYMHGQYSWSETTPASEVGSLMEEAFWTCNQKVAISTMSTQGVLPASQVRLEPEEGLGFVDGIPVLPQAITEVGLIKKLIGYGVITEITVGDIKSELEAKALTAEQLRRFLGWLGHKAQINEIDPVVTRSLLDVVVANDEEAADEGLLVLSQCQTFINTSRIPAEMPVPPSCLPFKFTKKMERKDLEILGFEDLQMVPWLRWLTENAGDRSQLSADQDITQNLAFATAVLPVVAKQWNGLSPSSKTTAVDLLSSRTIMPTKLGLRKPSEAYFPNVQLFDDLPNVRLNSVKDTFLAALGVRKTIDLGVIFERLFDTARKEGSQTPKSSPKWSHADLIKYLASVKADIPAADIAKLRNTRICPAENEALQPTQELYLISELFEPDQMLRKLRLQTLHWPGVYRPESSEGRFLTYLGLRNAPSPTDLIAIMANSAKDQKWTLREHALRYFIEQHQTKGYANFDHSTVKVPYLPIQGSEEKLVAPTEVFVNERSSIFGFNILRRDLQIHAPKFGVRQEPPILECVDRLINSPPTSSRNARDLFSYLASRTTELKTQHVARLSEALIVPVPTKTASSEKATSQRFSYCPPRMCFLGVGERYAEIFDFVDFGQEANTFLLACGSKHEPSMVELARRLISEPAGIFSSLGDARYLELLRSIADSWKILKKDKTLARDLKASRCLLAYKEIPSTNARIESEEEDEADSGIKLWQLATASQIVIIDDTITYNLFREALLAAPMEDALEDFYHSLGSAEVGTLVEEQHNLGSPTRDQSQALKLQRLICERTRLFLNDFPADLIKHNYMWVQKNLTVECVQSISVTRMLRGYNIRRTGSRSAIVAIHKSILYITPGGGDIFEVSQALVPVLLNRSKPQYVFVLEMLLESSLQKLRSRGYNIDRILRSKAAKARIAEETRKQQVAEEQHRLREQEIAWRERQAAAAAREVEQPQLPGVFPDSPGHTSQNEKNLAPVEPVDERRPRGLFSGLSKMFELDRSKRTPTQSQQSLPIRENGESDSTPPPPYTQERAPPTRTTGPPQPESVTAPHHLQQNLINAIQSSRGHNSNAINSTPTFADVKETATYCDAKPGHDIKSIGETLGVRVFVSNKLAAAADQFLAANGAALKLFASIVLECANAFSLNRSAVHVFYDDSGSTIAFNTNKALFFNYRYFENLHLANAQQGKAADAIVYWSVVMAHELAHNLVSDHSAQHSFYTEALVIQYFARIAGKVAATGQTAVSSTMPDFQDPLRQQQQQHSRQNTDASRLVDVD